MNSFLFVHLQAMDLQGMMETKDREVCVRKQDQEGQMRNKVTTRQKLMLKGRAKCEPKYVLNLEHKSRSANYK